MELRFEGNEELGYDPLGVPPRGEICLRGPMIFAGYHQDKAKTAEAFGARAWPCPAHCPASYLGSARPAAVVLVGVVTLCSRQHPGRSQLAGILVIALQWRGHVSLQSGFPVCT